jgi:hypothetical protein
MEGILSKVTFVRACLSGYSLILILFLHSYSHSYAQRIVVESIQPGETVIQLTNFKNLDFTDGLFCNGLYGMYGVGRGPNGSGIHATAVGDGTGISSGIHSGWSGYFVGGTGFYAFPRLIINDFNSNNTQYPLKVGFDGTNGNGAHLTAGGTWTNGSSKDFKVDLEEIDPQLILQKSKRLEVYYWRYNQNNKVDHIGPVAEDFVRIFEMGSDNRYISTVDADGVNLSIIQGLAQRQDRHKELLIRLEQSVNELENLAKKP